MKMTLRSVRIGVAALLAVPALLAPTLDAPSARAAENPTATTAPVAASAGVASVVPDASGAATAAPAPPRLRLPAGAHPVHYNITMSLDPNKETFSGTA